MKLILISGHAESGKDTFANILKEKLEKRNNKVKILHFADYLKYLAKLHFGWDGSKSEEGRQTLQALSKLRDLDPKFFIRVMEHEIEILHCYNDYILIPDVRFKNELNILDDLDRWTVRIDRPFHKSKLTQEQKMSRSERELDDHNFDFYISATDKSRLSERADDLISKLDYEKIERLLRRFYNV